MARPDSGLRGSQASRISDDAGTRDQVSVRSNPALDAVPLLKEKKWWQLGVAGRANIITFDGEDIVGVGYAPQPDSFIEAHNKAVRELIVIIDQQAVQLRRKDEEIARLRGVQDRNLALGLELGQILGPEYDGVDLREVARDFVRLQATTISLQDQLRAFAAEKETI